MTRVVIADDQDLVRTGFRLILGAATPPVDVVGEAATGRRAVELVGRLRPDVVLMDIRMPDMDGIEATRTITASGSTTRVLVLTTFGGDQHVHDALRAGASGFLLKNSPADQLADAVRAVASGDALLSPDVTRRLIAQYVRQPLPHANDALSALTPREREVLTLVARGRSNAEIATDLYVGVGTVKTHVTRVLSKLALRDRVQAVVLAYESGLVRAGDVSGP